MADAINHHFGLQSSFRTANLTVGQQTDNALLASGLNFGTMIEIIILNDGIGRFVIRCIIIDILIVIARLNRRAFIAVSVLSAGIFRVRFSVRIFFSLT